MNYTIQRTGNRPLTFSGDEIASADSQGPMGRESSRWHTLTLYRTQSGKFIVHVAYRTQWDAELDHDQAIECQDEQEVAEVLRSLDPCEYLVGYRPFQGRHGYEEQFEKKQFQLERSLRQRYEAAVSELLADMPERIE